MKTIDDFMGKRTWNDYKRRKDIIKGKFDEKEIQLLMNALCSYVKEHEIGIEGLIALCSKSKEEMTEEMKGAWCSIAEYLPYRSVQSIHNLCRRKFNPNNYSGKWNEDEE